MSGMNRFTEVLTVSELKELSTIVGFLVGFVIVVLTLIGIPIAFAMNHTCHSTADKMGFESDWGFWTGCMIEVDDRMIPLDRYLVNNPREN